MSVSVVIPHYFVGRTPYLRRIAADFRRQTVPPCEVVVWNNEAADILPPNIAKMGLRIIQADHNHGCQARIKAAQETVGEFVLFMDNDTTAEPGLIASLLGWAAQYPDAIVTLEGRQALPAPQPYRRWPKYLGKNLTTPRPVSMSLGRGELVPQRLIPRLTQHFPFGPPELMDDLWWSACAAWEKVPIMVVPSRRGLSSLINLPDHRIGACAMAGYYGSRDETVAAIRAREGYPRIWE